MAMSAVGPGFLTQTATFTQQEGANFGFAILMCIIVDVIVQLNIWRVIIVSGAGLGLNVLFGIPTIWGAVILAVAAVLILVMKNALKAVDRTVQVLPDRPGAGDYRRLGPLVHAGDHEDSVRDDR